MVSMRIKHILTGCIYRSNQKDGGKVSLLWVVLCQSTFTEMHWKIILDSLCMPKEKSTTFHISMTISPAQKDLREGIAP